MTIFSALRSSNDLLGLDTDDTALKAPLPPEIAGLMSVLLRLIDQRGSIVVYLSAASHGEGTTTIARELAAAAMRWDWCKVALVDASGPAQVKEPNVDDPVLLVVGDTCADIAFQPKACHGGLFQAALIDVNTSVPRVDTVRTLFDRLRKHFTLVIVDSPPILTSKQMSAFGAAADCVVFVVEAERTRSVDLDRARCLLEQLGAQILGIVLNKRRQWVPSFLALRN